MTRILIILFSIILVFLIGRLWVGNGSFPKIWDMQNKIDKLSISNQQRLEENRKLEAEIQQFQEGTEAIEARARSDFGMIKKGETFYQIILDDQGQQLQIAPETSAIGEHGQPIQQQPESGSKSSSKPGE